jgi:polar amino acid transport system substrate-binding protein
MLLFVLGGCAAMGDRPAVTTAPSPEAQATPGAVATAQSQPDTTRPAAPPLRVGITPNYPPIAFQQEGTLRGLEPDLARALGQELGRPVVFVEHPWKALMPSLEAGEIDVIMSGMSITVARQRRVRFVQPYLRVGQMAIVRKADLIDLGSPELLYRTDRRVGFVAETTGETLVKSKIPKAQYVAVTSADEGLQALRQGQIDAFVHDAVTAWRVGDHESQDTIEGLFSPLTEEYLAWAVRKDDEALHSELNAVVAQWRRTGRFRDMFNKWLKFQVQ